MKHNHEAYNLVFGISIYDIFGFTSSTYRSHDSNPGRVKVSFGGVCRNIAENMARVGGNTKFISILGNDEKGKSILEHAKSMNFDMSDSLVVEGASTPTYVAILDENGEMVSAIVDINIDHHMDAAFIDSKASVIEGAEYMFFGADNPECIEYIVKKYAGKTKFVLDPVSAAKAKNIKHLLPYFHTVKPNRHEAEVLCDCEIKTIEDVRRAGAYFMEVGVENVFISLDADGVYYCNQSEEGIIKPMDVKVVNVTGAGDAFIAGIGYAYLNHMPIAEAVQFAQTMSIVTISHEETIHPHLCHNYVKQQMNELTWDMIKF
ncbi:MAG: carbohydrate kinase family protein [Turicibacter sanguinis]|jgi:kinase, pfkB family|uniref:Kinase n=2 Tax=Turicibacter sanguinis TaxID=154288 RepID=A0A9X5APS9_9FIRM|nr:MULTISPECIES: carbohydrate kinase family protein [Turicibacter]EFF62904.1 kinase, PfkB family [Turicibacter sanguinis PC909]MBP3903717.1 carbohydrate kinase family protein [Turicibacter sp.]MCU7190119.1 carbohydrate kinase family protein [Turicibacter sanguinis]MCU7196014.1 carbohydrate kinase family protein [Turicibacter sanguinis]MCU7202360.1 carbohydrate kinase family protein [Turicibacter sanguinis]